MEVGNLGYCGTNFLVVDEDVEEEEILDLSLSRNPIF